MNLVPLYEEVTQFNNFNGTVLAAGKVEVWYLGRTRKADIYADVAGEAPLPNPLDLNDLGMQEVYVNAAFNYTLVVYDPYGAELFSVDKYLQGTGGHTISNVVVQPSETVGVSAWTEGEVQIYQPYLSGDLGKTYEGISPIVVNNTEDKISAQTVSFGVQEPLFFVKDDEEGCIIGCSASEIPSSISGKWEEASDAVETNSAQWAQGTTYSAGANIDITDQVISVTGLQPSGDYAMKDDLESGLSGKMDKSESADFYPMEGNPSGFLTTETDWTDTITAASSYAYEQATAAIPAPQDLSYISGQVDSKLPTSAFSTVSGDFITALPADMATTGDIADLAESISETYQPKGDYLTTGDSAKFYTTANESGFITGVDLTPYQTTAGMTAYQPVGDYYSASNPSGFITGVDLTPYQTTAGMTAYQPAGDYLTTADSAEFYTTANPSGFLTAETDWTDTITAASANAYEQATAAIPAPFDPSYISAQVDTKLDSAIYAEDSGSFLTSLPSDLVYTADIQDMATTGDLTAYQPKGDYLTTGDSSNFYTTANESGFITGVDLTPYQTTAGMTAYQPAGDYLTTGDSAEFYTTANPSGFITGVDLSNYATTGQVAEKLDTTAFSTVSGNFLTSHQSLTGSGNWDSTYTTVSTNSANWAANGDVYVSGFEYTTGGNISGYSGSAFVGNDETFELAAGYGISLVTGAGSLTVSNTITLSTGSI